MGKLLAFLKRGGLYKGLLGGNRVWLALGVGAWGFSKLRDVGGKEPVLVAKEELRPGQRLVISHGVDTIEVDNRG